MADRQQRVALVGAGMMGGAILGGLVDSGFPAGDLTVVEPRAERAAELQQRYGVRSAEIAAAVAGADVVLLVVKPADVAPTLDQLAGHLRPGAVLVSVAAGVTTEALEARLPAETPVVRVMPNTPALLRQGMAAISPGRHARPEQVAAVQELLEVTGAVVQVPEKQQDAVTAVSGSGPAYVFLLAEAMIDAGVLLGLPRVTASELVIRTLTGAAAMLADGGSTATELREHVTSPGGTTAAALRVLEERGLRAAFMSALEAARDRSRELSQG